MAETGVRLFVDQLLSRNAELRLDGAQAHYLISVMRAKVGDSLRLFDNRSGEWLGQVMSLDRRSVVLHVEEHLGPREEVPDLILAAAPIRRARYDWVAEKACELGVARFVPVMTRRAVVDKVNAERLRARMIEAAEQCGRTALPEIAAPVDLAVWLGSLDPSRMLFFADEEGGLSMREAFRPGPAAILIGPEGGFTPEERAAIRALPNTVAVSLGPRILRADTAAVAAVAIWMALAA